MSTSLLQTCPILQFTEEGELLLEVWAEGVFPPYATAAAAAAAAAPVVPPPSSPAAKTDANSASAATSGLPLLLPQPDVVAAPATAAPQVPAVVAPGAVPGPGLQQGQQGQQGPEASWPLIVLHFSVRDTGIGIAPEDLGRLFNSFTQVGGLLSLKYQSDRKPVCTHRIPPQVDASHTQRCMTYTT